MSFPGRHGRANPRLGVEELEQRLILTVATFAEAGTVFNDATRVLEGGLWKIAAPESNQPTSTVIRYVADLTTVQTDLAADVNAMQFTGATLAHVNTMLGDIATALKAAPASVNGVGSSDSVADAQTALRNAHLDVLSIVQRDDTLAGLATAGGAAGFQQVPPLLQGITGPNAPHQNLAQIGAIFNDAANRILGGVNKSNVDAITDDVHALIKDLRDLIEHNPTVFSDLTGIHADVIVRQLQLELHNLAAAGVNPLAARASNDVFLDIIDIVQGDPNLAQQATQGGTVGFAAFPSALYQTPRYLDNQAQTEFIANLVAQSDALGQTAVKLVNQVPKDKAAIVALIVQLRTFKKNVAAFEAAQGGIFEARFDNELLGDTSTLGAAVAAMITGLRRGNQALVAAAAEQLQANAAAVSGNNLPAIPVL
jgi:hypothetical protein